ncbi:Kelch repeat-containing protein [Robertkochia flava]|uniref:Kelch repeat-containing protein n=1 Tax=Robertkochia flava TaxID=3447986 RepID=UPI001CCCF499|nr:hypothetical protein [Robertkochia marina]
MNARGRRMCMWVLLAAGMFGCGSDQEVTEPQIPNPVTVPQDPVSDPPAEEEVETSLQSSCTWEALAPSGVERLESQTAIVGTRLYTFSGFTKGLAISAATEIYELEEDQWTTGAPMPVAVTHMGAAVVQDRVWIVGGFIGDHPGEATALVQVYNTGTDLWETGPELPSARASGALVYLEGRLHYFGGLMPDRRTDLNEHLVLDLNRPESGWQVFAPLPEGRNHLGGVALHGKIYAVGGQFGHDGAVDDVRLVHVYDPSEDRWSRLEDLPTDRSHFEPGIFTFENRILVAGGRSDAVFSQDLLVYDPEGDSWEKLCDLPEALLAPVARVYDNRLLLLNGGVEGVCCPVNLLRYIVLSLE